MPDSPNSYELPVDDYAHLTEKGFRARKLFFGDFTALYNPNEHTLDIFANDNSNLKITVNGKPLLQMSASELDNRIQLCVDQAMQSWPPQLDCYVKHKCRIFIRDWLDSIPR